MSETLEGSGASLPNLAAAIEQTAPDPSSEPAAAPIGPLDVDGLTFDPAIHVTGPDGGPVLNARGLLARKRGPKAAHLAREKVRTRQGGTGPTLSAFGPQDQAGRFRSTAEVTVSTLCGVAVMRFGEQWRPSPPEHAGMVDAWERYYRVRGILDLPPEVGLISATLVYVTGKPERRAQIKEVGAAIFARMRGKNARSDYRADGNGKDDTSSAFGERI